MPISFETNRQRLVFSDFTVIVALVTSILAGISAFIAMRQGSEAAGKVNEELVRAEINRQRGALEALVANGLGQIMKEFETFQQTLTKPGAVPESRKLALAIGALNENLSRMDKRLAGLEQALLSSPERALAVPLIRQDLDNFRQQHQRDVTALTGEVGRVYDMGKWIFGFIVTSLISLSLTTIFAKKKE